MGFSQDMGPVDQYGQPVDPYAEYGRGPPTAMGGYAMNGSHMMQQEEDDDFGGYYGYR